MFYGPWIPVVIFTAEDISHSQTPCFPFSLVREDPRGFSHCDCYHVYANNTNRYSCLVCLIGPITVGSAVIVCAVTGFLKNFSDCRASLEYSWTIFYAEGKGMSRWRSMFCIDTNLHTMYIWTRMYKTLSFLRIAWSQMFRHFTYTPTNYQQLNCTEGFSRQTKTTFCSSTKSKETRCILKY